MGSRKSSKHPRPAVLGAARAILRGDLDKVGLPTLLTIVEMERRSGIFVLQRQDRENVRQGVRQSTQLGRIHVREGRIIRASIEGGQGAGARRCSGGDAVYQMLTWPDGQFELWSAEVAGRDEIGQCTAHLLMEGMRRIDEASGPRRERAKAQTETETADRDADRPAREIVFAF